MEVKGGVAGWAASLLEFRDSQGFSREKYELYLKSFCDYCRREFPGSGTLTAHMANGWLDREAAKGFRGAQPEKATVIRTLANYIRAFGGNACAIPFERHGPRIRHMPYVFSDSELEALFRAIDRAAGAMPCEQAVRGAYSVMFRLIYTCGLRPQEGRLARRKDLSLRNGELAIRETKFHAERIVGISEQMVGLLSKYCGRLDKVRPGSEYLFPKRDGVPVGKHGLGAYFKGRWREACREMRTGTPPRVRVYDLRHRFASAVLQRWTDEGRDLYAALPLLRAYMGHSEISSTLYYVHLLPENLRMSPGVDWNRMNALVPEVRT